MSSSYYFLLGSFTELAHAELVSVAPGSVEKNDSSPLARTELESDAQAADVSAQLGGAVKVFKQLWASRVGNGTAGNVDQNPQPLTEAVKTAVSAGGKQFGLSVQPSELGQHLSSGDLKQQLQAEGVKTRFRPTKHWGVASALLEQHPDITDVVVTPWQDQVLALQAVAAQDISGWAQRDRGKPYANRRKGLLPPKLARMMVNLALGGAHQPSGTRRHGLSQSNIYDPFCGSGTILMEAAVLGHQVWGSDLDPAAVEGTLDNLSWLAAEFNLPPSSGWTVFQHDAGQPPPEKLPEMDAIVTEPFLGKLTPKPAELDNIFRGLAKLYLGAFKQWRTMLADGARVVIVLPRSAGVTSRTDHHLRSLIDKLPALGYTTDSGPYPYSRPNAVIEREIFVLSYHRK